MAPWIFFMIMHFRGTLIITLGLDGISWEVLLTLPARAAMLTASPRWHHQVGMKSWRLQGIWKCLHIIIFHHHYQSYPDIYFLPEFWLMCSQRKSPLFFSSWNAILVIDLHPVHTKVLFFEIQYLVSHLQLPAHLCAMDNWARLCVEFLMTQVGSVRGLCIWSWVKFFSSLNSLLVYPHQDSCCFLQT